MRHSSYRAGGRSTGRAAVAVLLGAVGSALGWFFHARHFYIAYAAAYASCAAMLIAGLDWGPRAARGRGRPIAAMIVLAMPLMIGWWSAKLARPWPIDHLNIWRTIATIIGAGAAAAAWRVANGTSRDSRARLFGWLLAGTVAGLAVFLPRPNPWRWVGIVAYPLQWVMPQILLTQRPKWAAVLNLAGFYIWVYSLLAPLQHPNRLPYGNWWVEASCVALVWGAIQLSGGRMLQSRN